MSEMLSCPSCGGEAQLFVPFDRHWWVVRCNGCEMMTKAYPTEPEAIAAWDRRAAPPAPASTGEAEWLRAVFDAGMKQGSDEARSYEWGTSPDRYADEVFEEARAALATPQADASSGWEAGAEAMRLAAVQAVISARKPHEPGPHYIAIFHASHDAIDAIRALPLPPAPSREG